MIDFGYRALKETTDDAKDVIAAFSQSGPKYSYFMGCSDGGREGLMEAQRFPDDFNGIIVGAPGSDYTHQMAGTVADEQALLDKPPSYIPWTKLPIISKAVLAQCRTHDTGAPGDGFLSDPQNCKFDPHAIQCARGQNPESCLTRAQVVAVKAIYSGSRDSRTGRPITAGFPPTGNEDVLDAWTRWIVGSSREADLIVGTVTPMLPRFRNDIGALKLIIASQYFGYLVYKDPNAFDFRTVDVAGAIAKAEEGPGKMIDATNPDLRPFEAHGGKIIQYHGWADAAVTPWTSVNYYDRVNAFMYAKSPSRTRANYKRIQSFYRLFILHSAHLRRHFRPISPRPL